MKIRLRPFDSRETLRIEVPNSCSLLQLKQILSQTLPDSPPPASIRLSLNRKDELLYTGAHSIQSLGIASGDLVFYSIQQSAAGNNSNSENSLPVESDSNLNSRDFASGLNAQNILSWANTSDNTVISQSRKGKTLDTSSLMEVTQDRMELNEYGDNYEFIGPFAEVEGKSFSVPGFLRKVFMEELGNDSGCGHKLIIIAVHAVMLELGFVRFDRNANAATNDCEIHNELKSELFKLSLFYTLPVILCRGPENQINVALRFQSLGNFISVYGSLYNGAGKKRSHGVRLNEDHLVPLLNVVWANCGVTENIVGKNGIFAGTSPEKEVFRFWCNVKDSLALPLLIDICEAAGLGLPPCFMRLPTDLKLKILESLPGIDVARISCVCSELCYLASSSDLWKLKFTEQFPTEREVELGNWTDAREVVPGNWKNAFVRAWQRRNNRTLERRRAPNLPTPWIPYPYPPMGPYFQRYIRDDPNILPGSGSNMQFGARYHNRLRRFAPACNLGGPSGPNFI